MTRRIKRKPSVKAEGLRSFGFWATANPSAYLGWRLGRREIIDNIDNVNTVDTINIVEGQSCALSCSLSAETLGGQFERENFLRPIEIQDREASAVVQAE